MVPWVRGNCRRDNRSRRLRIRARRSTRILPRTFDKATPIREGTSWSAVDSEGNTRQDPVGWRSRRIYTSADDRTLRPPGKRSSRSRTVAIVRPPSSPCPRICSISVSPVPRWSPLPTTPILQCKTRPVFDTLCRSPFSVLRSPVFDRHFLERISLVHRAPLFDRQTEQTFLVKRTAWLFDIGKGRDIFVPTSIPIDRRFPMKS